MRILSDRLEDLMDTLDQAEVSIAFGDPEQSAFARVAATTLKVYRASHALLDSADANFSTDSGPRLLDEEMLLLRLCARYQQGDEDDHEIVECCPSGALHQSLIDLWVSVREKSQQLIMKAHEVLDAQDLRNPNDDPAAF